MWFEFSRVVAVIAMLIAAACLATPAGKLPLALRGIRRIMRRDSGLEAETAEGKVSQKRRIAAFFLVVLAAILACL
jgi:hypothetical protein